MEKAKLIMVGGFLGAGKTTLLYESTKKMMQKGFQVGIITNDQAVGLVDTVFLLQAEAKVEEISGSCFCCNYHGFVSSIEKVRNETSADIIFAEPVGSCTDLSATIMQPLKEYMHTELEIAPLTVLADPYRLKSILDGKDADLHPSAAYIFRKQLEESDIIAVTKCDLLRSGELEDIVNKLKQQYSHSLIFPVSSITGFGIDDWFQFVMSKSESGQRITDVDYNVYAEGEAVLGWLNATLTLSGNQIDWDNLSKEFMIYLGNQIDSMAASVGHVKILVENCKNYLMGNLTGNLKTLNIRGNIGTGEEAFMIINARVGMNPEILDRLVRESLDKICNNQVHIEITSWKCLSPGYPKPIHRYSKVI